MLYNIVTFSVSLYIVNIKSFLYFLFLKIHCGTKIIRFLNCYDKAIHVVVLVTIHY